MGIGTTSPSAKLHTISTTEQLRLGYDGSNYTSFTNSSGGIITIAPTGGIIEQKNSSNKQTLKVYNNYTDASNYRYGYVGDDPFSSGTVCFGTTGLGSGVSPDLRLRGGAQTSLTLSGSTQNMTLYGNHLFGTDNTYDIGASGLTRPRTGYFGTSVIAPTLTASILNTSSGNLTIAPSGGTTNVTGTVAISGLLTNVGGSGQTTLVAGTTAITVTGVTTNSLALVQLVTPSGVTLTTGYQAVCTANTITIQANVAAGTINAADGSTLNYFVIAK